MLEYHHLHLHLSKIPQLHSHILKPFCGDDEVEHVVFSSRLPSQLHANTRLSALALFLLIPQYLFTLTFVQSDLLFYASCAIEQRFTGTIALLPLVSFHNLVVPSKSSTKLIHNGPDEVTKAQLPSCTNKEQLSPKGCNFSGPIYNG